MGGPSFSLGEAGSAAYTGMDWSTGKSAAGNDVYYIYNSWFAAINKAKLNRTTISDPTTVSQVSLGNQIRGCFYCHTTGYGEAEAALIGVGTSTKWQITGIVCGSCHKNQPFDNLSAATAMLTTSNLRRHLLGCSATEWKTGGPISDAALRRCPVGGGDRLAAFKPWRPVPQQPSQSHRHLAQIIDRSMYGSHFRMKMLRLPDPNPAYRTKALRTAAGKTWHGSQTRSLPDFKADNGKPGKNL
jgi:hypothetical protein